MHSLALFKKCWLYTNLYLSSSVHLYPFHPLSTFILFSAVFFLQRQAKEIPLKKMEWLLPSSPFIICRKCSLGERVILQLRSYLRGFALSPPLWKRLCNGLSTSILLACLLVEKKYLHDYCNNHYLFLPYYQIQELYQLWNNIVHSSFMRDQNAKSPDM